MLRNTTLVAIVFFGSSLTLTPSFAFAEDGEHVLKKGWGALKCSDLTSEYSSYGFSDKRLVEYGLAEWGWGYMTAKNSASADSEEKNADLSLWGSLALADAIIDLCTNSPDVDVYEVVDALFEKLVQESHPSPSPGT